MSSFYPREDRPQVGDIAKHNVLIYVAADDCWHSMSETVTVMGQVAMVDCCGSIFWLVEKEDESLIVVKESDLYDIGYYGD